MSAPNLSQTVGLLTKRIRATNIPLMSAVKELRERLKLTQTQMATHLGVTQGNVSFYEKGQTVPPAVAGRLIDLAKANGVDLTYDGIYSVKAA